MPVIQRFFFSVHRLTCIGRNIFLECANTLLLLTGYTLYFDEKSAPLTTRP